MIWVVEMKVASVWLPTCGVGLTRADAIKERGNYKESCPDDKFRVVKYLPEYKRSDR